MCLSSLETSLLLSGESKSLVMFGHLLICDISSMASWKENEDNFIKEADTEDE